MNATIQRFGAAFFLVCAGSALPIDTAPDRLAFAETCLKVSAKVRNGQARAQLKKIERSGPCKKGEASYSAAALGINTIVGPKGEAGATGPKGDTGQTGQDGSLRIFGDGSAGTRVLSGISTSISGGPDLVQRINYQYQDLIIESDAVLSVPSGTVIRCSGSFVNNGKLQVLTGAAGSDRVSGSADVLNNSFRPAHPGLSRGVPSFPRYGPDTVNLFGGEGGEGIGNEPAARSIRYPLFGGGGSTSGSGSGGGASGGGAVTIICRGAIENNGEILARGTDAISSGGGGGGVVILASLSAITQSASGIMDVSGGNGGDNGTSRGPSGGGGGGFVHLIAPIISDGGQFNISGGQAGAINGLTSATLRSGGGGGGASYGSGGRGGNVPTSNFAGTAEGGNSGRLLKSEVDPTGLF